MDSPTPRPDALPENQHQLVWTLLATLGHADCGGWTYNPGDAGILCACGQVVTR